jgi:hypothetical protein
MPVCPYCSAPIEGQPIALDADLSCAACGRQLPEQRRADHPASSPSHLPVLAAAGKLWTVADQAVISATNFVTMLLLARQLTPSAFGEFTLVYTGFLFANILQNTLVSQPMNVLGPAPAGAEYARYLSGTLFSQIIIMSIELLVCAALAATAYARGWHIAPLLLGVAPAVVAWQLQEFVRRALYVQDRLAGAFMNDLIAWYWCSLNYFPDFLRLSSLHSIWQLAAMVFPPSRQGLTWSACISSNSNFVFFRFSFTHHGQMPFCRSYASRFSLSENARRFRNLSSLVKR